MPGLNLPRVLGKFVRATPRGGRIVDDPLRRKRCTGPRHEGARELPVTAFYANRFGFPQSRCKACHRQVAAESARRRSAARAARLMDRGEAVRVCCCHKLVCWVRFDDDSIRCQVTGRRARRVAVCRMRGAA